LEGEGADRTFELPLGQDELIEQIEAINSKAIVLLTSGGNVDMNRWIDKTPVLLETWYAGQEQAQQLRISCPVVQIHRQVTVSFEKRWEDNPVHDSYYPIGDSHRVDYQAGVFVGYRGYQKNGVAPRFPFGFGLSYTSFVYKDLKIAPRGMVIRSPSPPRTQAEPQGQMSSSSTSASKIPSCQGQNAN